MPKKITKAFVFGALLYVLAWKPVMEFAKMLDEYEQRRGLR